MRLLLFVLYYAIALAIGFALRSRYDDFMYRKTHMQARIRIWAQEVISYDPESDEGDQEFYPPSTMDAYAFNPAGALQACEDRQKELDKQFEERFGEGEAEGAAGVDQDVDDVEVQTEGDEAPGDQVAADYQEAVPPLDPPPAPAGAVDAPSYQVPGAVPEHAAAQGQVEQAGVEAPAYETGAGSAYPTVEAPVEAAEPDFVVEVPEPTGPASAGEMQGNPVPVAGYADAPRGAESGT